MVPFRVRPWPALSIVLAFALMGCSTMPDIEGQSDTVAIEVASPTFAALADNEVRQVLNDARAAQYERWTTPVELGNVITSHMGVVTTENGLVAAVIDLLSGDQIIWMTLGSEDPVVLLRFNTIEADRHGQGDVNSMTFVNLQTGATRTFSAAALREGSAATQHEVLRFVDSDGHRGCIIDENSVQAAALDPICYDDCMRGAQATCAGTCTLALLAGGPPAYIACFGACMSVWHATCLIGCDF